MANVIVVSAHPDDEVIGAGGTLLKHIFRGDKVFWLIVTGISEKEGFSVERVRAREAEISAVSQKMGITRVFTLGYPTMQLSSSSVITLAPRISEIFTETGAEIIYTVNRSDAHSDHRFVFDAVMASTKSFRHPRIRQVLMYECLSETEFAPALAERVFLPNYFVDITEFMEKKVELLGIYASELGAHPFPRSFDNVQALGLFRGAIAGVGYAEAFQLLKFIDKD